MPQFLSSFVFLRAAIIKIHKIYNIHEIHGNFMGNSWKIIKLQNYKIARILHKISIMIMLEASKAVLMRNAVAIAALDASTN